MFAEQSVSIAKLTVVKVLVTISPLSGMTGEVKDKVVTNETLDISSNQNLQ